MIAPPPHSQWLAGTEPPRYDEVGPYAMRVSEKHYNVQYSDDWNEVEFTYHQWGGEHACVHTLADRDGGIQAGRK